MPRDAMSLLSNVRVVAAGKGRARLLRWWRRGNGNRKNELVGAQGQRVLGKTTRQSVGISKMSQKSRMLETPRDLWG